jgi:hypothetical protein
METNGHPNVNALVSVLQGLPCWYVSCGGAALHTFQLALGNKVPRRRPLKNPKHSAEYRAFEGEANLLVWCAWRLDGPDGPLTSWDDSTENIETMLGKLVGATIETVAVTPGAWDLTVRFTGNLTLRVFCDHVPPDPSFDGNWELWLSAVALIVGPGARCTVKPRSAPAVPADS